MKSMIVFFAFAMILAAVHAQYLAPAIHSPYHAPILATNGLGWVGAPLAAPAISSSWITTDNAYLPAASILLKK